MFTALELTFSIDLSTEEGGSSIELVKGGRDIDVNATNVYVYVRKYSQYRYVFTFSQVFTPCHFAFSFLFKKQISCQNVKKFRQITR